MNLGNQMRAWATVVPKRKEALGGKHGGEQQGESIIDQTRATKLGKTPPLRVQGGGGGPKTIVERKTRLEEQKENVDVAKSYLN